MIRIDIILFIGLAIFFSCSEQQKTPAPPLAKRTIQPKLDSIIQFKFYSNLIRIKVMGNPFTSSIIFISLHDDETTGQQVVSCYLKKNNSAFIRVENNQQRLIKFKYLKKNYVFDPNRIFTKKGILLTLGLYGNYSDSAEAKVYQFASLILQQLSTAKTIIAIHNNSKGKYSILSYLKGGEFFKNAKQVNRNLAADPEDFFLTTSPRLFQELKAKKFNIVLQDNVNVVDNGSLSVYYRNINKCYINIEAQEGHFVKQSKMLQALMSTLQ